MNKTKSLKLKAWASAVFFVYVMYTLHDALSIA